MPKQYMTPNSKTTLDKPPSINGKPFGLSKTNTSTDSPVPRKLNF